MHILHYIVVRATDGEEACSKAESLIDDYGDGDNWRTMCGAVSQHNEVYLANDGRYEPNEDSNTIEKISAMVQGWIGQIYYGQTAKTALAEGRKIEDLNSYELWSLSEYAKEMATLRGYQERKAEMVKSGEASDGFDVLKETYNPEEYDANGVTNLIEEGETEENDGIMWVVFLDMHT